MTVLRYLGRRCQTAWKGISVCREHLCGRPVWHWTATHCAEHR